MRNRFFKKGRYFCTSDCEICEGKGYVVSGMEGFINRRMEQDCRDTYEACENATYEEDDDPGYSDDWREAKERRMEKEEA